MPVSRRCEWPGSARCQPSERPCDQIAACSPGPLAPLASRRGVDRRAGGLFGGWVMNGYQRLWTRHRLGIERPHGAQSIRVRGPLRLALRQQDAPMSVARPFAQLIGKRRRRHLERGGTIVHYAFSGAMGALYGCLADRWPQARVGRGTLFGTWLWAAAEIGAVPALGLSRSPQAYPPWVWAYGLTSHWTYGIAIEQARRRLRSAAYESGQLA